MRTYNCDPCHFVEPEDKTVDICKYCATVPVEMNILTDNPIQHPCEKCMEEKVKNNAAVSCHCPIPWVWYMSRKPGERWGMELHSRFGKNK